MFINNNSYKKKLTVVLLCYIIVLIFAACGGGENISDADLSSENLSIPDITSSDSTADKSDELSQNQSGSSKTDSSMADGTSLEYESDIVSESFSEQESLDIDLPSEAESSDEVSDIQNSETSGETSETDNTEQREIDVPKVYINASNEINRDMYVDAELRIYDPEGVFAEIYDSKGEVRIRGNSTSSGAKKPYNIKFESKKTVLGLGTAKKWCLLANMYDKTLIRNKLVFDFATEIGMRYVPGSAFVDVYVNGIFMGNYLLTEAVAAGDTRVEIDTKRNEFLLEYEPWEQYSNPESIRTPIYGVLFGFNDPEFPTNAQRNYLNNFLANAEAAIASGNLNAVKEYYDLSSMVDFYIVNEFFKDVDFSTSSTRFYIKNGKIYGGPIWDMDLSSGNCASDYYEKYNNIGGSGDSTESIYCDKIWYGYLLQCDGFLDMVKARYKEILPDIINLSTDNELGKNKIDSLLIKYGKSFEDNYSVAGWSMTEKYSLYERIPFSTYEKNIHYLRQWLVKRNEWLLEEWNIK